ncbi:MAG: uroporphyrinogen decarboxylase family protein [Negativicutes bacterium]|nr:uroporphyrinogen decarboxylase family protein [Negativicutes bacterium]
MTPREIALQVLRPHGETKLPRRPAALLSGGTWTFRQKGLSLKDVLDEPATAAQMIAEVNDQVLSDIVWPGSGYHNLLVRLFGGSIKFRPQGNIDVTGPAFKTISAADGLDFSIIARSGWIITLLDIIAATSAKLGDRYLIGTSSWGPFTLAGQFYGVEKVMSGLYKDKQGIHALLEIMTEVAYRYLAPAVAQGAELLSVAEPTASGDLISQRHFEEYVAPYLKKLFDRLRRDGALITLHICGNITDRLATVADLGVDLLSVDYKVDLATAAKVLGNKAALAGNLNPLTLKDGEPEALAALARRSLDEVKDFERFILMPGCDIPPATPLANVKAFLAAGRETCN